MRIVDPVAITDARLLACNITEDADAAWDVSKSYVAGDMVIHDHVVYYATKGLDPDNYDEWSATTEYLRNMLVKVSSEKKVYKSLQGDPSYLYLGYDRTKTYLSGDIVKSTIDNRLYKCLLGEDIDAYSLWSSGMTYAVGDHCYTLTPEVVGVYTTYYARSVKIYKCIAANTDKYPDNNTSGVNPSWRVVGIVNLNVPPHGRLGDLGASAGAWDSATTYPFQRLVYVEDDAALYWSLRETTGEPPAKNLAGDNPAWCLAEGYYADVENGVWQVYASLNAGHSPPESLSGTTVYWEEYGDLNVGYTPALYCEGDDAYWAKMGSTNKWAQFDPYTNTATTGIEVAGGGTEISWSMRIDSAGTIAFFNLVARDLSLVVRADDGTVLWSKDVVITPNTSSSWFSYFYGGQAEQTPQDLFYILPRNLFGNILDVVISSPGTCTLGMFRFGYNTYIGTTLYEPKVGIVDYSKKTTNDYGDTTLSVGAYKKYCNIDVSLEQSDIDKVFSRLASFRGRGVVVVADNSDAEEQQLQSMLLYGFLNDWYVNHKSINHTVCTVEVTGLI